MPSTARVTASPVARTRSSSALSWPTPGCGGGGAWPAAVRRSAARRAWPACQTARGGRPRRLRPSRQRPGRIGPADQRRGVGQGDHDGQAVRHDVVQFPGDPGPLGGRGDRGLLVPLELQPPGALVHPGQVAAARGGRHPGEQRGDHGGGEEQQRARHRAGRLPLGRGHDRAGFQHPGGEQGPGPGLVGRHRVQRDQQGYVAEERGAQQPLRERDRAGGQEHRGRPDPADHDQADQRGLDQPRAQAGETRLRQPHRAYRQEHRRDQRVDGQRVRVRDRRPWPNRLRVISSGGWRLVGPRESSVIVPNVRPSRSLTGSVPPAPVPDGRPVRHRRWSRRIRTGRLRPEDEPGRGDFVLRAFPRAGRHRIFGMCRRRRGGTRVDFARRGS